MGVLTIVRKLNLGDFLWIARERVSPVPGQLELPPARELVLDYVVSVNTHPYVSHGTLVHFLEGGEAILSSRNVRILEITTSGCGGRFHCRNLNL